MRVKGSPKGCIKKFTSSMNKRMKVTPYKIAKPRAIAQVKLKRIPN